MYYKLEFDYVDNYQNGKIVKFFKTYKQLKKFMNEINDEDMTILNLSVIEFKFEEENDK